VGGVPGARIRNADEADVPQMVENLLRAFQGWPAFEIEVPAIEHLRWKMRSDPISPRNQWVTEVDGQIADLLALPGRTDVVRSLVEDALDLFREAGVELVTCWMISRHPYNGILRRYGFIDSRRDAGFSCYPLNPDSPNADFVDDPARGFISPTETRIGSRERDERSGPSSDDPYRQ
jgi:hypothetical protein